MRKKKADILRLIFTGAVVLLTGCSGGDNKTIAKIGETAITRAEFQESLKRLMPQQGHAAGKEDLLEIKKDLLNQLIEEKLLLAEAQKASITVSDEELSGEVESMKKEFGDQSFNDTIVERYGNLERWKEEIRKKLIIRKTVARLVGEQSPVTENEAKEYYGAHPEEFTSAERVRARMIVVASEEQARNIRKGLTAANFAETARKVSMSPDRENGGDLGFFSRGGMPAAFEDAVFKLNPGGISQVIKTEYGFHIFLLEGKKKGGKLSFGEVRGRIVERLRSEKEDSEFRDWMISLKKKARIEVREDTL
ncbi:MAG: peptidyl-prolyl cis-trans isomerase [Deltaproteobacteria bacterium]|nr:peptidyl-prolyl cis-trans isomerase [Deltaproteobacteria bacterium]